MAHLGKPAPSVFGTSYLEIELGRFNTHVLEGLSLLLSFLSNTGKKMH